MDLAFLKSNRFWALILLALVIVLKEYSWISLELASALEVVFGGFIGIRTIDRGVEYIGKIGKA